MITREELLKSAEFWLVKIQNLLYQEVKKYLKDKDINQSDFAVELGVSKGYVSQVLNGDYNHKLSKFIELSLAIGKVPIIKLENLEAYIEDDAFDNDYLMTQESIHIIGIDVQTLKMKETAIHQVSGGSFFNSNNPQHNLPSTNTYSWSVSLSR